MRRQWDPLWCIIVVFRVLVNAARYLANPGEFPFVVVITSKNGSIHSGILTAETTVMSDWFKIGQYISIPRELLWSYPCTELQIVASNGDWQNDPKKQTRYSYVVFKHPNYRIVNGIPVNNVALIFIVAPFTVTPYIVPVQARVGNWSVILEDAQTVQRIVNAPTRSEVFIIGGLACPDGECDGKSPMFRYTTNLLSRYKCEKVICDGKCKELNDKEIPLCFAHGGVGGAGSPVLKDLHMVGIGNYVTKSENQSYLIVTPFLTGAKMVDRLSSRGVQTLCTSTIFMMICSLNVFFAYLINMISSLLDIFVIVNPIDSSDCPLHAQ